jgi:hypothetical protein
MSENRGPGAKQRRERAPAGTGLSGGTQKRTDRNPEASPIHPVDRGRRVRRAATRTARQRRRSVTSVCSWQQLLLSGPEARTSR